MLKFSDAWWPLALATMAGLSTSLGAIVAVVRKPSASSMATLLGVALGVMATVSCVELVARNAMSGKGDPFLILAAAMSGALTYYILEPLFPKMDDQHDHLKKQDDLDGYEAFFQLQQQQQTQQQQLPYQQHLGCDVDRSGHGASQRKVITSSAGCYITAVAAAAGAGGAGDSSAVMTATAVAGGPASSSMMTLTRKGSSDAALSSFAAVAIGGGGDWRESGSFLRPGPLSWDVGGEGASTALPVEGLAALGAGALPGGGGGGGGSSGASRASDDVALRSPSGVLTTAAAGGLLAAAAVGGGPGPGAGGRRAPPRADRMLRLGVLMAVTMTLHNLPEGFAVAFSAFTDFGPIMALAIALHNIPEGVIVAAPIYAATGSRWRAVGIATASGLSEPFGALLSLLLLQPFFTQERLRYLLAFVGGIMLAVCGIELWPEGRNCRHDRHFAGGILGGSLVMAWTLYVEG